LQAVASEQSALVWAEAAVEPAQANNAMPMIRNGFMMVRMFD
jgi:hypothetical protein